MLKEEIKHDRKVVRSSTGSFYNRDKFTIPSMEPNQASKRIQSLLISDPSKTIKRSILFSSTKNKTHS